MGACAVAADNATPPAAADAALAYEDQQVLDEDAADSSLKRFLDSVEGLQYQAIASDNEGYSAYRLDYPQPVDHADPEGRSFSQRIILHHRDEGAPMVLYTSGYGLFRPSHLSELTVGMAASQINVEQRFFGESRPADVQPEDWAHLNIEEAAADHHRIIEMLSDYYHQSWLSTGHSKGGMTSVYHRRFYPDDVDATVAYVAPISFGAPDARYDAFTSELGSSECRVTLRAAQIRALERYSQLFPLAQAVAEARGAQFTRAGGHEMSFETAIASMEWAFWQNSGADACALIPAEAASDAELFEFVRKTVGIGADDLSISLIDAYYVQAGHQLGYPSVSQEHLIGLLKHQGGDTQLYPQSAPVPSFDSNAMQDIQAWLAEQSTARILFVYGESDPWTGGAFDTASCGDCPAFSAPGESHAALLEDLPAAARAEALLAIERWTGIRATLGDGETLSFSRSVRFRLPPAIQHSLNAATAMP
jgi:hypothetical protein